MSRKSLLLCVCIALCATMALTGTLAYLTSTDSDVNVMTIGNVKIDQIELQRAEGVAHDAGEPGAGNGVKTGALVPFKQGQQLYPAYPVHNATTDYTAEQNDADLFFWGDYVYSGTAGNGLWDDKDLIGALDKFVFVKNTGSSDAYFRTIIALECPVGTDYSQGPDKEFMMNINGGNTYTWSDDMYIDINGTRYLVTVATYQNALKPGQVSHPSLLQLVMTHNATNETVEALGDTYDALVLTQAMQTKNFETVGAAAALDVGFGEVTDANVAAWFGGITPVTAVTNAEELAAALAKGGTVTVAEDMTVTDQLFTIAAGQNTTLILEDGVTLTGRSTSTTTSMLFDVKQGATLTLKGSGTISFEAGNPDTDWGVNNPSRPFPGYANNTIKLSGKLIVDGVTIENTTAKGGASYAVDCYQGSELIVESGKILGYDKIAIRMFCNSATLPTSVTINGGEVSGYRAVWVQLPSSNASVAPPVNLTVNGGTLRSTDSVYRQAIYSYTYGNSFANTNIAINGGTFYGDIALTGGTLKDPTENFTFNKNNVTLYGSAYSYCTDPVTILGEGDGVMANDAAALADAIANGKPALLTSDVEWATAISNDASIDLNNNTFNATSSYELKGNSDLTMANGTYEANKSFGHVDVRPNSADGSVVTFEDMHFVATYKGPTYGTCTDRLLSVLEFTATEAGGKAKILFKDCIFDNAKVLFEGMSGKVGTFEATFENCTFNALTSSAPIEVMNYVNGTITVKDCTFNIEATSSSASAVEVTNNSTTSITLKFEGSNTVNAKSATAYTFDPAKGETEVYNVKLYNDTTVASVKAVRYYDSNTTCTGLDTVTVKGIATK